MTVFLAGCVLLAGLMFVSFQLAWGVALWTVRAGERWRVVSAVTERSSHARPTSRLGGIALAAGFFLPAVAFVAAIRAMPAIPELSWGGNLELMGFVGLGALLMFGVGLADDLWDLPPLFKLGGQLAATLPLAAIDFRFLDLVSPPLPGVSPDAASAILVVAWIVFFVNAFNFMDGLDGFAAGFAKGAFLWILAAGAIEILLGQAFQRARLEFLLLIFMASACEGFLKTNRPPARVFMGDGGSHLLGYLLAVQVVLGDGGYFLMQLGGEPTISAGAVWLILLPFVFDPLLTLVRRARLGENLLVPHRSHLYQRLAIAGASHARVWRVARRHFVVCGAAGAIYAVADGVWNFAADHGREWPEQGPFLVRVAMWGVGVAAMLLYWLRVLREERRPAGERGGDEPTPEELARVSVAPVMPDEAPNPAPPSEG